MRHWLFFGALLVSQASHDAAQAGTSRSDLLVSVTVAGTCSISTSPLTFGTYDPNAGTDAAIQATASVNVACTSGAPATIMFGQGIHAAPGSSDMAPLRQMSDGTNNAIGYALYRDPVHTVVWGNTPVTGKVVAGTGFSEWVSVYGAIAGGQSAPPGEYADTVVVTISF